MSVAGEDPDLEAFRAKLKQGGGMSRGDRESWRRARPLILGFVIAGAALGSIELAKYREQTQKAAASAKEEADRKAKVEADFAEDAAFDARFASIAAPVAALDPSALERAAPSLVAGRKILGLLAQSTSVFEKQDQGSGGVFAGSPAEVGIVVTMTLEILKDRPVKYEGGAILAPTRKTFTAIAWPEKKVVAKWTELWMPPSEVLVTHVGKHDIPTELGPSVSRWKADAAQLAAGAAPTSIVE